MRSRTVGCVAALSMFAMMGMANAKQVTVCNAAPFQTDVALSLDTGRGHETRGWYPLQPGECRSFHEVVGGHFYYHAWAYDDLAKWLGGGEPIWWRGFYSRCVDPTEAFYMPAEGQCAHRAAFTSVALVKEHQSLTLYEGNHRGIALSEAMELRRVLTGRMEFEQMLIRHEGREAPFQLGVAVEDAAEGGALIKRVRPGMPAEAEGLAPGDRIVALNGYTVRTASDLVAILDDLDILRTEPLAMSVVRNGIRADATIAPLFYEFNHREHQPSAALSTGLWLTVNGIFFNWGNELACASLIGLAESMEAVADDRDFRGKSFASDTSQCSKELNRELAKREVLYPTAAKVAFWASLLVPEAAALKSAKLARSVPLAARSRYVARKM